MKFKTHLKEALNNYIVYHDGCSIEIKGFNKNMDMDDKEAIGFEMYENIISFLKKTKKSKKMKNQKITTITVNLKEK